MKDKRLIILVVCSMLLAACGVQKKVVEQPKEEPKPVVPQWHTCVIQGANAVVTTADDRISATVNMTVVHDSLLIVNIMPFLGIEMARLEATPTEIVAFDKVYNRYAKTTYAELNQRLVPKISWKQLQQICSGELPTGDQKARLEYSIGKDRIIFDINYAPRKLDIPVKMNRLPTNRYKKMDINEWL